MNRLPKNNSKHNSILGITLTLALSACATENNQPKAEFLASADADAQHCQYLGNVEGKSGFGKNLNWKALAKDAALKQADKLHASKVVLDG